MATEVAVRGSVLSSSICRWAFSITTIASSTTRPVASVMPNSVSELIENPKILMNANVPISDTGIVTAGMMVARQSSRKKKITTMTIRIASSSVVTTSLHRIAHNRRGIESDDVFDSGREGLRKLFQRGLRFVHLQRVGIRELLYADSDGFMPAVHKVRVVALSANLRSPNILQLHNAVALCSSE